MLETPGVLQREQRTERFAACEPDELADVDQAGVSTDEGLAGGAEERHRSGRSHVERGQSVGGEREGMKGRLYTTEQQQRETNEPQGNGESGESGESGEGGGNGGRRGKAKQRGEEAEGSGSLEPPVFIGEYDWSGIGM